MKITLIICGIIDHAKDNFTASTNLALKYTPSTSIKIHTFLSA